MEMSLNELINQFVCIFLEISVKIRNVTNFVFKIFVNPSISDFMFQTSFQFMFINTIF